MADVESDNPVESASAGEQAKTPLTDLMLVMDVVDTLRHEQRLVDQALGQADQDAVLIERVKAIYRSQGIDVTDAIIQDGVKALKEERYTYTPPEPGFANRLAHAWVNRKRWYQAIAVLAFIGTMSWGFWYGFVGLPEQRAQAHLAAVPSALETLAQRAQALAEEDSVKLRAGAMLDDGMAAVRDNRLSDANQAQMQLDNLINELTQVYSVQVIYRPGESSGVWRIPPNNDNARNYYLIVEAITEAGQRIKVQVTNEEDQKSYWVDKWGLRVSEEEFNRIRDDKQDDGIIQQAVVGQKPRGYLSPQYSVDTTGATITDW